MVQPSWFKGKNYVKHERWVELWRDCLRVNYEPNIDIRAVKTKTGEVVANVAEQLQSAVAETLKYSVKPEDMANDPEWFLELTRQLHKRRFISTGGALKNVLQLDRETNEDLVIADDVGMALMTGSGRRLSGIQVNGVTNAPLRRINRINV